MACATCSRMVVELWDGGILTEETIRCPRDDLPEVITRYDKRWGRYRIYLQQGGRMGRKYLAIYAYRIREVV